MKSYPNAIPLHTASGVLCTSSDSYANILYPHYHNACELSLILSGIHEVELENETIEMHAGGLMLLRSNEPHSRRMLSPGRHITLAFSNDELERLDEYIADDNFRKALLSPVPPYARLQEQDAAYLARSLERINLFCTANPSKVRIEVCSLLLTCWCRHFSNPDSANLQTIPWMDHLLTEIENPDNIRRGLEALLEKTPYTHEYLCREFRRLMGCTPTDYINSLRLDRAHSLLENTNMRIVDICCEVGFESVSYFHKLFRKKYGASPASYRKMRFMSVPDVPREQCHSD